MMIGHRDADWRTNGHYLAFQPKNYYFNVPKIMLFLAPISAAPGRYACRSRRFRHIAFISHF